MARQAVLHRTLRIENRNDRFRIFEWCLVNTSVGMGWEPFQPMTEFASVSRFGATDPDDLCRRIDKIEFDADRRDPFHRDGDNQALIGGLLFPLDATFSDDAV